MLLHRDVYVSLRCLRGGNIPNEKSLHSATLVNMLTSHKHAALDTHGWRCNTGLFTVHYMQVKYIIEITRA